VRLLSGVISYCLVMKESIIVGNGYIINWQGAISWPHLIGNDGDELPEDIYILLEDKTKPREQLVIINMEIH
jgi:hypothetical protein